MYEVEAKAFLDSSGIGGDRPLLKQNFIIQKKKKAQSVVANCCKNTGLTNHSSFVDPLYKLKPVRFNTNRHVFGRKLSARSFQRHPV